MLLLSTPSPKQMLHARLRRCPSEVRVTAKVAKIVEAEEQKQSIRSRSVENKSQQSPCQRWRSRLRVRVELAQLKGVGTICPDHETDVVWEMRAVILAIANLVPAELSTWLENVLPTCTTCSSRDNNGEFDVVRR